MVTNNTANLLTDAENKIILKYDCIKNSIKERVGVEKLTEVLSTLVLESKTFDFKNKKAKDIITCKHPLFILKINDRHLKAYTEENKGRMNAINIAFYNEVIIKYSEFITEMIKNDNGDILNKFSSNEIEFLKQEDTLKNLGLLTGTLFRMYADPNQLTLFFELVF